MDVLHNLHRAGANRHFTPRQSGHILAMSRNHVLFLKARATSHLFSGYDVAMNRRATVLVVFSWMLPALHAQPKPAPDAFAAIRQYARQYSKSLPDYTCTRVTERKDAQVIPIYAGAQRFRTPQSSLAWSMLIEEELIVSGQREHSKLLKARWSRDWGPEWKLRPELVPANIGMREFGSVLDGILKSESGAVIRWVRSDKLRGRPVLVFSFEVPRQYGEHVYDLDRRLEVTVGYAGLLFADAETNAILRVETHSSDFSGDSEYTGIDLALDYKAARIGDREFVLPYGLNLQWHRRLPDSSTRAGALPLESSVRAEYKNYRGYTAQSGESLDEDGVHSTITFGGIASPEKP
jgi:hypothetical protein